MAGVGKKIFILIECKLESSHCHSVWSLWSHLRNYTKSVAVSGQWIWPSLGFVGPVHPLCPQFNSSLLFTGNTQVAVILYIDCRPLHSFASDFGRCFVYIYCTIYNSSWNLQQQLQSATAAEISSSSCNLQKQLQSAAAAAICSSSWKCQKPAAKQLLGTAGGTVRYGRRYGLPITVKIITPLYSS